MVNWECLSEGCIPDEWDLALSKSEDGTVFQAYSWGEYKRTVGWVPRRWLARNADGAIVAMVQILTKSLPIGITIGWTPGGPAFLFPRFHGHQLVDIVKALLEKMQAHKSKVFIRFNSHTLHNAGQSYAFNQACMRPVFKLTSGYTIHLDLGQPIEVLMRKMTAKHRYYVKQSLAEKIQWTTGNDRRMARELVDLHTEMIQTKNLDSLRASFNDVSQLCAILGKRATILTGYVDNEAVTSCLALTFGWKAFYMMAATGRKGRELSASYAMVYQLLEYLLSQGVTQFDFGGIDPQTPAAEGVNHFKRGFGGEIVEYLGEWEWAGSQWVRWVANLGIWRRAGRL